MLLLVYDIEVIFSTTYQKEEGKLKSYVTTVKDVRGVYLNLGHLYELKSPYTSLYIHECSH